MGAGVSRHGQVRRKVQAVNAFEDAGKRHRRKKNSKKSNNIVMKEEKVDSVTSSDKTKSHWMRVKERTISKTELESRSVLRLSDFNKVVRKRTLEKEDDVPISIPYVSNEKVRIPPSRCVRRLINQKSKKVKIIKMLMRLFPLKIHTGKERKIPTNLQFSNCNVKRFQCCEVYVLY